MIRHTPARVAASLSERLAAVRQRSIALIAPLEPEDLVLQGMADASPPKWHLGHTTWFFETFVLVPHRAGWQAMPEPWPTLFNSYYEAAGPRHPRPQRGLLSRPTIGEVLHWRKRVDAELQQWLHHDSPADEVLDLIELGLQHEQQHQELLLMDLLDGFHRNPMAPAYSLEAPDAPLTEEQQPWLAIDAGLVTIGHDAQQNAFHFDNEAPQQRCWLEPYAIAAGLVSNATMDAFIADGGYRTASLWMAEGWALVQEQGWQAPRYWRPDGLEFTLKGLQPRQAQAPVRHLSWFEADALARWLEARLPSEAEWEWAARSHSEGHQWFGSLWQWTSSAYAPYRGFRPAAGAVGEYNGKFMSSQMVLRGSSFLTPAGHERLSYRNFFGPHCRWQPAGLRLARDL